MVRMMGLRITGKRLIARLILATVISSIAFFLLFYLPQNITTFASGTILVTRSSIGSQVLSSLVSPTQPTLGVFIAMLVFAGVLLRGSRVFGPILIQNGLAFLLYVYSFFQGGIFHFSATGSVFGVAEASLQLSADLTFLMALFLVPTALTIVKGVLVTRDSI